MSTYQDSDLRHMATLIAEMTRESQETKFALQRLAEDMKTLLQSVGYQNDDNDDIEGRIDSIQFEISVVKEMLSRLEDKHNKHVRKNRTRGMINGTYPDDVPLVYPFNQTVRILCYVPVSDAKVNHTVAPVMNTWGKRCNKLLFFAHESVPGLPVIGLEVKEVGRYDLAKKMFAAMFYLYSHYLDDFDWFLKADTDTYVVVENLRPLVAGYDPTDAIYFGHPFQLAWKQWMSGGAGYVISREGLRRYGEQGHGRKCMPTSGAEDVAVGKCMQALAVKQGDSRDSQGRSRFHCLNPLDLVVGNFPSWMFRINKYPPRQGVGNISDTAISFHNITGWGLYMLDYFIYRLQHRLPVRNAEKSKE